MHMGARISFMCERCHGLLMAHLAHQPEPTSDVTSARKEQSVRSAMTLSRQKPLIHRLQEFLPHSPQKLLLTETTQPLLFDSKYYNWPSVRSMIFPHLEESSLHRAGSAEGNCQRRKRVSKKSFEGILVRRTKSHSTTSDSRGNEWNEPRKDDNIMLSMSHE
jgi:hypothetical protein